jgi:anti-sigma factor RsiW
MAHQALELLFERLIRQREYPGDTCPAEHVLVAYQAGALPASHTALLEKHFAECESCKADFAALRRAGDWFQANEALILAGIADKAAAKGLRPWAECPSPQLLYRFVDGAIPESGGGKTLIAQIRRHLSQCPDCIRCAKEREAARRAPRISLLKLGARAGQKVMEALRSFANDLAMLAQARGAPAFVRAAPGYRSLEAPRLTALVLDPAGKVVVSDDGKPRVCRFDVIQANIKMDGFLTVDLSATNREYHAVPERQYDANLNILTRGLCLEFPESPIDDQGRCTFTGMLPGTAAVDPLPLLALDVTVRQQAAEGLMAEVP